MSQTIADGLSRIIDAKTNIDNTITAKGGVVSKGLINTPTDIATIPSGGDVPTPTPVTVKFFDYDGTTIASYTGEEFDALTQLPENPTHTGLTSQGWGITLADAKTYVANNGNLNLCQQYAVTDGKSKLYITLPDSNTSPTLKLYLTKNSEIDIDWGDGSTVSHWVATMNTAYKEKHQYPGAGNYIISITLTTGSMSFQSSSNNYGTTFTDDVGSAASTDRIYMNAITKVVIDGANVSIGNAAFSQYYNIEEVVIGTSITSLGDNAFNSCYALKSICIPGSVTSVGTGVFRYCDKVVNLAISPGVTTIGQYAFSSCYNASPISIPSTVTSLGTYAFAYNFKNETIKIPDGVTNIDNYAFYENYGLAELEIGSGLTTVGSTIFGECTHLKKLTIDEGVTSIGSSMFSSCTSLTDVSIPSTAATIQTSAFSGCSSLREIEIPEGVTLIKSTAFSTCTGLEKVTLPSTLTEVQSSAFSKCYSLREINLPEGLVTLGVNVFDTCYSLQNITLPSTLTSVGKECFTTCKSLTEITVPSTLTTIGQNLFSNCVGLKSAVIESPRTTLPAAVFTGCTRLQSVSLPNTMTSMDSSTFSSCECLTSVNIPTGTTMIQGSSFSGCSSLYSITIPEDVTIIKSSAFANCYSLKNITIPSNVATIQTSAFSGCKNFMYIKFEPSTPPAVGNTSAFSNVPTTCLILVPIGSYNAYITGTNYPATSKYTYLVFGTYTSGTTLPDATPDSEYSLVWYASMADATSETNPITVGNGNEVYARATAIISVSRYVDFPNNTTTITGSPSSLTAYTGINRCNVADDGTINAYYGDAGYTEDGSNGQVMVKIPKFYYKVIPDTDGGLDNDNIRKCTWKISDSSLGGYTLHPAFYDASGNEIDYFLYGAFDGVGQNSEDVYGTEYNTSSDRLASVAGSTYLPLNTFTRATARTMAANRGAGWYQAAIKQTAAVQMLIAVEYGFNTQKAIGNGVVNASAATYAGQTTGNITSGTTSDKITPVNWRGVENFWGNIWDWIDGLNTVDRVPYICTGFNFADATASGDTQITFALPSEGYVTALGYDSNNDWVLLPSETSSTAAPAGPIGDYLYSTTGQCVAQFGGRWQRDQYAGAFFWCCNNGASKTGNDISARLMFIPTGAV